jgi:hypothetical protein
MQQQVQAVILTNSGGNGASSLRYDGQYNHYPRPDSLSLRRYGGGKIQGNRGKRGLGGAGGEVVIFNGIAGSGGGRSLI